MFVITDDPIDVIDAHSQIRQPECGGVVSFQGRVRDHNNDKRVEALEYEVYRPLAVKEATDIFNTLKKQHGVGEIHSRHRVGRLEVGELSFWLGVSAPHRKIAFEVCQEAVTLIKKQVPIWKKELYGDGTSRWINQPK